MNCWHNQASLSFIISQSLFKFMSIESVMPSNHLVLCHPLLLLTSNFTSIRVSSNNLDFIKSQNFCVSKNTTKRVKRQSIKWGKAFTNYISNKELLEETHWKRPWYAGKDWGQGKRATHDKMVEWHHQLNGHEFEQTPGDSEVQGSLACCSPQGCKELDMTEWLNNKG